MTAGNGDGGSSARADAAPGVDDAVPATARPAAPERFSWWGAAILALALVVASPFFGVAAAFWVGVPLLWAGIAYAAVAMPVIAARWVLVPRRARAAGIIADGAVVAFSTGPQRVTLVLNALLLLNLGVAALALLPHDPASVGSGGWVLVNGSFAVVGGLALIAANGMWAYGRRFLVGEAEAIRARTGAWRIIRLNRVAAWAVWLPYFGVGVWLLATSTASL